MFYAIFSALDQFYLLAEILRSSKLKSTSASTSINKLVARISFAARLMSKPLNEGVEEDSEPCTVANPLNGLPDSTELDDGHNSVSPKEQSSPSPSIDALKRSRSLKEWKDRFLWGFLIGILTAWAIVTGGLPFTVAISITAAGGAWEYCRLMNSGALSRGEKGISPEAIALCCFLSMSLPFVTWIYDGRVGWAVLPAALPLACVILLQFKFEKNGASGLRSQITRVLFGLFYCGYLPCFWIKVRLGLSPWLVDPSDSPWDMPRGSGWTVGAVATFMSFATIMAADSFAYIGGKFWGRTQLTSISPKKTWEGAFSGLFGALLMTVALSRVFNWPSTVSSVLILSFLIFVTSVFGDLFESFLKRDAGMKDSGSLIPGHGGILDRIDSYVFTGAIVYCYVSYFVPRVVG